MESRQKYQKKSQNKQLSRPKSNKPSFVDNLVSFKALRDQGNIRALEVWNEYQRTKNEKIFEEEVEAVVGSQSAIQRNPPPLDEAHHDNTSNAYVAEETPTEPQIVSKDDHDVDKLLEDALKGLMSSSDSDEKTTATEPTTISSPFYTYQQQEPVAMNQPSFRPSYPPSMMPHYQPAPYMYPIPHHMPMPHPYPPSDVSFSENQRHLPLYPPYPMPYRPPYPFDTTFVGLPPAGYVPLPHHAYHQTHPSMMFVPMSIPQSLETSTSSDKPVSEPIVIPSIDMKMTSDIIKPIDLDMLTESSSSITSSSLTTSLEGFDVKIETESIDSHIGSSVVTSVLLPSSSQRSVNQQLSEEVDDEAMMQSRVLRIGLNKKKSQQETKPNDKTSSSKKHSPMSSTQTVAQQDHHHDNDRGNEVQHNTQPQPAGQPVNETSVPLTSSVSKSKALLSFLKAGSSSTNRPVDLPIEVTKASETVTKAPPKILKRKDDHPQHVISETASSSSSSSLSSSEPKSEIASSLAQSSSQVKPEKRRNKKSDTDIKSSLNTDSKHHDAKQHTEIIKQVAVDHNISKQTAANEVIKPTEPAQPTVNRSHQLRTTRNQIGRLIISSSNNKLTHQTTYRPNQSMMIFWELPASIFDDDHDKVDIVIGLTRYGSAVNLPCIITKHLSKTRDIYHDNLTNTIIMRGKISFYAPKSAGRFVYRVFDQSSPEKARTTISSSCDYHVELDEINFEQSLKFISDLFIDQKDKNSSLKAIVQLTTLVHGTNAMATGRGPKARERLDGIITCINHAIKALVDNGKVLDDAFSLQVSSSSSSSSTTSSTTTNPSTNSSSASSSSSQVQGIGTAKKVHVEVYNLFQALHRNKFLYDTMSRDIIVSINSIMSCYCPLLQRFFSSLLSLQSTRRLTFGFQPALAMTPLSSSSTSSSSSSSLSSSSSSSSSSLSSSLSNVMIDQLNNAIINKIPSLIPNVEFDYQRDDIRHRLQNIVMSSNIVPHDTIIELYGSSKNNFGNSSSDVDMCVVFPTGYAEHHYQTAEDRGKVMEAIGHHLIKSGMLEVQIIATARMPVVSFRDPISGLDCDITYHNPLAIKNTLLLRAYSEIDPRVRIVAYIIKHWAKNRQINNPGDGTLSSYGFILCFIHFLQRQSQPILPNLQAIPYDWNGDASSLSSSFSKVYEVNVVDGSKCNIAYHHPTMTTQPILKAMASKNTDSPGTILAKFFHYYAWEFDYINDVVSISSSSPSSSFIKKIDKAESAGWLQHERLSIEDPFETWYDVAHVIKKSPMKYIRKEFLRAYTLIIRAGFVTSSSLSYQDDDDVDDALPKVISSQDLLNMICEPCDPPPFARDKKKADDNENNDDDD